MKRKFSILALLVAIATTAMAEVAIGTQVSVSELENGAVYTIQGYRGGDRYMYYNGSTYDQIHTTTEVSASVGIGSGEEDAEQSFTNDRGERQLVNRWID